MFTRPDGLRSSPSGLDVICLGDGGASDQFRSLIVSCKWVRMAIIRHDGELPVSIRPMLDIFLSAFLVLITIDLVLSERFVTSLSVYSFVMFFKCFFMLLFWFYPYFLR